MFACSFHFLANLKAIGLAPLYPAIMSCGVVGWWPKMLKWAISFGLIYLQGEGELGNFKEFCLNLLASA